MPMKWQRSVRGPVRHLEPRPRVRDHVAAGLSLTGLGDGYSGKSGLARDRHHRALQDRDKGLFTVFLCVDLSGHNAQPFARFDHAAGCDQ